MGPFEMNSIITQSKHTSKHSRYNQGVTVCIAAICDHSSTIVCVCDRMLTAGDIQFEPPQKKIVQLSNRLFLLLAGDAAVQCAIWQEVINDVAVVIQGDPNKIIPVKSVAEMYVSRYSEVRLKKIESAYLAPLGLTVQQYLTQNRTLAPELVKMLATEAINSPHLDVETLIVGLDDTGPHIFAFRSGELTNEDAVAFAAIGIGANHASSQFMFARHSRFSTFIDTIMLAYVAKKRSEVAPGVGAETDMLMLFEPIPPELLDGTLRLPFTEIVDVELAFLEQTYQGMIQTEKDAFENAAQEVQKHLDELGQKNEADQDVKPE